MVSVITPMAPLTRLHPSVRRRLYLLMVADNLSRSAILIELNPEYAEMARQRINRGDLTLFEPAMMEAER